MADRTIRVNLVGDATSLIAATNQARVALQGMGNVNLGNVSGSLRSVQNGLGGVQSAAQGAGGAMGGFATTLKTGLAAAGFASAALIAARAIREMLSAGMEYRANMNTLQAVTDAGAAQMGQLATEAQKLGNDLTLPGISAADAAEGMKELAKGGLEVQQVLEAARGTMALATAAQISGAAAATIQAKALNAFRLPATQAVTVANYLANAANAATGEITDMAWALQQSATVARGMGISMADTVTMLALFAKNGVIGSDAGTSLKTMLTQLASPTKEQKFALKDLNVQMFDAQGHMVGARDLADQLHTAYNRLTTAQYNEAAATAFGTDALRGANIIGVEGTKGFDEMATKVTVVNGVFKLAAAQAQGLTGAWNGFVSQMETVGQSVFTTLEPALMAVLNAAQGLVAGISKLGSILGWIGDQVAKVTGFFGTMPGPMKLVVGVFTAMILLRGPLMLLWNGIVLGGWGAVLALKAAGAAALGMGASLGAAAVEARTFMGALTAMGLTNPLGWIALAVGALMMLKGGAEETGKVMTDFTGIVDETTGALTAQANAAVGQDAAFRGLRDTFESLPGAVPGDLTHFITGDDPERIARVQGTLHEAAKQALLTSGAFDYLSQQSEHAGQNVDDMATALLNANDPLIDFSNAGPIDILDSGFGDQLIGIYDLTKGVIDSAAARSTASREIVRAAEEQAAADGTVTDAEKAQIALSKDQAAAIDGVMKKYDGMTQSQVAFANAIEHGNKVQQDAVQVGKYLATVQGSSQGGDPIWASSGARDAAAAMRAVPAAARDYQAAVENVTAAEQKLKETRDGSPAELKAIASAQKGVTAAQESAAEAMASLGDAQESAARSTSDAEQKLSDTRATAQENAVKAAQDLDKARSDSVKKQQDAEQNLAKVRRDVLEKIADAEQKLADVRAESAKDYAAKQKDLIEAQAKATENLVDAQKRYNEALKESNKSAVELKVAQERAAAARAKAADETIGASGSAQTAAFDTFAKAQDRLFALQRSGTASAYDLAKAQSAVDVALKNPNLARDLADAMAELSKAQEDNTKNSKDTAEAQDKLNKTRKEGKASVKDKSEALDDSRKTGKRNINDAEKDLRKTRRDGKESIGDAQDKVTEATIAGAEAIAAAQKKVADQAKDSAKAIASAQRDVSDAYQAAAKSVEDAQKRVATANQGVVDAQQAVSDAQAAAIPTTAELNQAERDVAAAKDGVASASDKQAAAMENAATEAFNEAGQTYELHVAQGDLAGASDAAAGKMGELKQQFIDSAVESGKTKGEAELLAAQYGLIPQSVKTRFDNAETVGAKTIVDEVNQALDNIGGKVVHWHAIGDVVIKGDIPPAADFGRDYFPPATPGGVAPIPPLPSRSGGGGHFAEGGFAGMVHGPGGPNDDKIKAWLSNGEFVVNAKQTAKHAALLGDINAGRNGFAAGGLAGAANLSPITTAGTVPVPDFAGVDKAWGKIGDTVDGVVTGTITPAIDKMDQNITDNGKGHQDLLDTKVRPVWDRIGKAVATAQSDVLAPNMARINAGTNNVGATMLGTLNGRVQPVWTAIGAKVSDTWNATINPNYGRLNRGTQGVASTLGTAGQGMSATWSSIGASTTAAYNNHIAPAHAKVTSYTTAVGKFFTGISDGTKNASKSTVTDLATINAQIDAFFEKVKKLTPAATTATTTTTTVTAAGQSQALADGGIITAGTGPRSDDVHIRASKGEYVVNAKATAKNRDTLDRINYGGEFADGGIVTGAAGNVIAHGVTNAIVNGTQRAISAGVAQLVSAYSAAGTSTATGYNPSQDPSSFGWVRAQGMVPYSWQGHNFGEVAGGTQGLWNALLNELVPSIPGGLNSNIGGFENRSIAGTDKPSFHSYGLALDLNSDANGRGGPGYGRTGKYEIPGTQAHNIANKLGMEWGGDWGFTDNMHFEIHVAPSGIKAAIAGDGSGAVGSRVAPGPNWLKGIEDQLKGLTAVQGGETRLQNTVDPIQDHGAMNMSHATAANIGPIPPGGLTERWRPLYASAIAKLGMQGTVNLDNMMYQMFRESSGDPFAIEETDSNFQAGHPSKGLLQTIPSTFRAYAEPGYSTNIWDPLSNAYASLNYVKARYGGVYPGGAYDGGGMLPIGLSTNFNGTSRPEPVLTDRQWSLANSAMNYVINANATSPAPVVTLNARVFVGGRELMDDVRVEVDNSFSTLRTEINLQRRQDT